MKPQLAISLSMLVVGCSSNISTDVFNTGKANYEKVNADNPSTKAETRVFIKNGQTCDYRSTRPEGAFMVTIGTFAIKQGASYLAEYLKARADYLSGDVTLTGKSMLSIPDKQAYWPQDAAVSTIQNARKAAVDDAKRNEIDTYKKAHPKVASTDKAFRKAVDDAGAQAGKDYDQSSAKTVTLQSSPTDLCILAIAGEYKPGANGSVIEKDFAKANKAEINKLDQYSTSIPAIRAEDTPKPFQGLVSDPSMVLEMHVVATEKGDKIMYTLVPTNLFYPNPLHKETVNGLERKLTITTKLADNSPVITFEHIKSGAIYGASEISRSYTQFEAGKDDRFHDVTLTIVEGPDKMPTAEALNAAVDKKDDVINYLVDKLTEKYGTDEQKAAAKK